MTNRWRVCEASSHSSDMMHKPTPKGTAAQLLQLFVQFTTDKLHNLRCTQTRLALSYVFVGCCSHPVCTVFVDVSTATRVYAPTPAPTPLFIAPSAIAFLCRRKHIRTPRTSTIRTLLAMYTSGQTSCMLG